MRYFLLASLLLCSCSPQLAYLSLEMPSRMEVSKDAKFAVENFSGRHGDDVAMLVENALVESGLNTLDRTRFIALVREGVIAGKQQALSSASIIVSGHVESYGYDERISTYTTHCRTTNGDYDAVSVDAKGIGTIKARVRFTNASTGQVMHTDLIEAEESDTLTSSGCDGQGYGGYRRPDRRELLEKAEEAFAKDFLRNVKPYKALVTVELFEVDKSLLPEVQHAHDLMKEEKLAEALPIYKGAAEKAKAQGMPAKVQGHTLYSYGVATGYLGNQNGIDLLDEAYRVYPEEKYLVAKEKLTDYFSLTGSKERVAAH